MDGIKWISEEQEQIEKLGFDGGHDSGELIGAAGYLLEKTVSGSDRVKGHYPQYWSAKHKTKLDKKSDLEKLIIAGALIAAEIDRIVRKLRTS